MAEAVALAEPVAALRFGRCTDCFCRSCWLWHLPSLVRCCLVDFACCFIRLRQLPVASRAKVAADPAAEVAELAAAPAFSQKPQAAGPTGFGIAFVGLAPPSGWTLPVPLAFCAANSHQFSRYSLAGRGLPMQSVISLPSFVRCYVL